MYEYKEKYDWRTREDAEILIKSQEIKSNPERFGKAASLLAETVEQSKAVLRDTSIPRSCRGVNKATIKRL